MNTRKGFTLVELLVVIAILAILATVSVVGYTSFINRANDSNAETEAHQIQTTIESYIISGYAYELGTDDSDVTYYVVELTEKDDSNNDVKVLRVCEYKDTDSDGEKEYVKVAALTSAQIKAMNEDFGGLPGELVVTSGVLTYKGVNASKIITIE